MGRRWIRHVFVALAVTSSCLPDWSLPQAPGGLCSLSSWCRTVLDGQY